MKSDTVFIPKLQVAFSKQQIRPRNPKLDHRITIRLDDEYYQELLDISHRNGFTISNTVRHLVNRFVENERQYGFSVFKGGAL